MIRVLVVDDHPAVQAGLVSLLRSEPGIVVVGAAADAADGLMQARHTEPDVAMLDYDLPDYDGLLLCCDLKALSVSPRVILFSAFARPRLAPAARVAGADTMLDKGVSPDELFETVRQVAGGAAEPPRAPAQVVQRCVAELSPPDIPLFGLAINGTPIHEIAEVAGEDLPATRERLRALVTHLRGGLRGQGAHERPPP